MASTSETALETTLNDLANARLRDKAPGLVNYLMGFQLLKCNDEGSRAVGIFGFEIDKEIYYCPVFFLNGEVKGLDSLYAVSSDLFMPLTEEWINSLIHRKAQKIGDPDTSTPQERGVRFPDYRRLTQLPPSNAKTAVDSMLACPELIDIAPSLPDTLRTFGVQGAFVEALRSNTKLAAAVGQFYDVLDLLPEPIVKVAAAARKLVVIGAFTDEGTDVLTDDQRRDVLRGGIAVSDKRPAIEHSMVWRTDERLNLLSPSVSGLYDVVMADGAIEPALCFRIDPKIMGEKTADVLIVTKDRAGFVPYRAVTTARHYSSPEGAKFYQDHTVSVLDVSVGDTVCFSGDNFDLSVPVTIKSIIDGRDGFKVYRVETSCWLHEAFGAKVASCNMDVATGALQRSGLVWRGEVRDRIDQVIVREGNSSRIDYAANKLIVSQDGCRAIKLGREGEYKNAIKASDLGDYTTVQSMISKTASDVSVWTSGDGFVNVRGNGPARGLSKVAAVRHLAEDFGIEGQEALGMVKRASPTVERYWVKVSKSAADLMGFPETQERSDTGIMSQYHQQTQPWEATQTTQPEDNSRFYDYQSPFAGGQDGRRPNGKQEDNLGAIEAAGQTGSKEVFDAAALMSIIKSSRPTELVERYLPAVIAGMDRLGRLLFAAFWHYDEYKERFGDDLPDVLDSLRSTFEHLGDIVTQIKKRSLSGDADHYGLGLLD